MFYHFDALFKWHLHILANVSAYSPCCNTMENLFGWETIDFMFDCIFFGPKDGRKQKFTLLHSESKYNSF